jgi:hypothetical protein
LFIFKREDVMKRLYLLLLTACFVHGLQGMNAEIRMREELVARATRRLQVKEEYAKLRLELTKFSVLPVEQQARDKEVFLKKIDEGFRSVAKLEKNCAIQNELEQAKSIRIFRAELNQGKVDLEAFEKIVKLSVSASAQPADAGVERKRDTDAQRSASERTDAERADAKTGAAQQAEAKAAGAGEQRGGGENDDHTAEDLYEAGVAGVMGFGVKGLIRQGGKWVLKGSNPWIAGGLTAIEVIRLARYLHQRNKKS